jgi:glycosyltransferase involved in cell wall biosynthesis
MRILFLTNLFPYPLDNGGKIKTYTTLRALSNKTNNIIDLVCFTENEKNSANETWLRSICALVREIPLKLTTSINKSYMFGVAFKSLFSRYSFGLLKYISSDMTRFLVKLKKINEYDCIYFDHLQMCVYYDLLKEMWPNARFILDEHNCEYLIMQRNVSNSKNLFKCLFLKLETLKLRKFESICLTKFDEVIVLSKEDDMALKAIVHDNIKTTIIPIGIKDPEKTIIINNNDLDCIRMLFIGTLSWAANNDGIVWFVENVVPKLKEKNIKFKLIIVGKNPGDYLKVLSKRYDVVELVGYVESVIPYYEQSDCMIVPLFVGSGQRVKIIEGFSLGIPIISTKIGAEGLKISDENNILIADDAQTFVNKIVMMKNGTLRRKLSINARKTFIENYSFDAVQNQICNVVEVIEK